MALVISVSDLVVAADKVVYLPCWSVPGDLSQLLLLPHLVVRCSFRWLDHTRCISCCNLVNSVNLQEKNVVPSICYNGICYLINICYNGIKSVSGQLQDTQNGTCTSDTPFYALKGFLHKWWNQQKCLFSTPRLSAVSCVNNIWSWSASTGRIYSGPSHKLQTVCLSQSWSYWYSAIKLCQAGPGLLRSQTAHNRKKIISEAAGGSSTIHMFQQQEKSFDFEGLPTVPLIPSGKRNRL